MSVNTEILDLVASYQSYVDAGALHIGAVADPIADSGFWCNFTVASSAECLGLIVTTVAATC
jgi:hypothetical protein